MPFDGCLPSIANAVHRVIDRHHGVSCSLSTLSVSLELLPCHHFPDRTAVGCHPGIHEPDQLT